MYFFKCPKHGLSQNAHVSIHAKGNMYIGERGFCPNSFTIHIGPSKLSKHGKMECLECLENREQQEVKLVESLVCPHKWTPHTHSMDKYWQCKFCGKTLSTEDFNNPPPNIEIV